MQQLKTLWQKQWFKNMVFFSFLAIAFFTDLPRWIQVQYTAFNLEQRGKMETVKQAPAVLNYDLRVEDVDGAITPWNDWKGEPILVNFWASWCVPCLAEFESFTRLQNELPTLELRMINLEDRAAFQHYMKSPGELLPFYRQVTPLPPNINPSDLPATYLIDAEGNLLLKRNGASDWSDPAVIAQLRTFLST
jgi:thiol-disulfide isomerase/thioredoxin